MVLVRMIGFIDTLVTSSLKLKYSAISDLHNFQFTVVLGFSVFASHLLAMDLNTETSTSNHYETFLLFRLQSLWNLGTKNSTGLTPPAYNWLVTVLNEFCHSYLYSHRMDMDLQQTHITWSPSSQSTGALVGSTENTPSSIVACWTVFTELLPGNTLIKSLTIFD
jgi:hypothetical protein